MAFQPKNSQSPTTNATKSVVTPSLLIWWVDLAGKTITCTKTHSGFFLQSGNQARHQGKTFFFYGSLTSRFFWNLEKTLGYPESGNPGNSPISHPVCHFWVHDFPFLIPLGGICDRSLQGNMVILRRLFCFLFFFFEVVDSGRSLLMIYLVDSCWLTHFHRTPHPVHKLPHLNHIRKVPVKNLHWKFFPIRVLLAYLEMSHPVLFQGGILVPERACWSPTAHTIWNSKAFQCECWVADDHLHIHIMI